MADANGKTPKLSKYPYQLIRENIQETKTFKVREEIIEEFRQTINRHSLENDTNTPDFILAEYLWDCLMSANIIICSRSMWYNQTNNGQFPGENYAAEQVPVDRRPEEKIGE